MNMKPIDLINRLLKESQVSDLVSEILTNLPEYSQSFDVLSWKYKENLFKLRDREDGKEYELTLTKAVTAFHKLQTEIRQGKFKGLSINAQTMTDPCSWDAYDVDALLQMAVLGEVVYG